MYLKLNLPSCVLSSLYRLKILCIVLCAPLFLYGIDYTGRLPSQITLQNGASQVSNAISTCRNRRGCIFGYNWAAGVGAFDFNYSTTNGGSSSLTLNGAVPTTDNYGYDKSLFYFHNLNVGSNSNLTINNFHTIGFSGAITLGQNASLKITLQKGQLYPESEMGKESQIDLSSKASIYLGEYSLLEIKNGALFDSNATITLDTNATFNLESTTINLYDNVLNKGTLNLEGEVWAVGQEITYLNFPATTTITNYGILNIAGNLHNGGVLNPNDPDAKGGGKLLNYGGSITITGNLINQSEGGQHSSVQIYGGSIKVDGGMTNAADSTLIFGSYDGKLGQLIGDVNNQGKIQVDIAGASLGSHQLITGTLSGNTNLEILAGGSKSEFINSSTQGNGSIKLEKNTQAIDTFLHSLEQNQNSVITALEQSLNQTPGQSLYTYGDRAFLTNLSSHISTSANALSTQAPSLSLWSIMQNTTLSLIYQPPMKRFSFGLSPFAANASSANLSAPLYGTSLNASLQLYNHQVSAFATYATSQSTNASSSTQTQLDSSSLLVGIYDKISLPKLELTLLAYYGNTQHKSKREVFFDTSTFQGKFSYNELGLQSTLGYPLSYQKLYFKPFVGLYYTLGLQGNMAESSTSNAPTLWFQSQQNHSVLMLLGGEARYYFGRRHILFGGVNLQYNLMPTPQTTAYIGSSPLYFDTQKSLGYTLHLGGSVPLHKNISLSLYALYAQSHTQFRTYSGTFNLSYYF